MGKKDAVQRFTIRAGVDAPESNDFARILDRMYERRAARLGLKHERNSGGELVVYGGNIGQFERGVHRLVRRSPFDPDKRRHTSFARVSINGRSQFIQRRSYVFDPYQQVHDFPRGWRRNDPAAFLDGAWEEPPAADAVATPGGEPTPDPSRETDEGASTGTPEGTR